jgi:hypothetical protein
MFVISCSVCSWQAFPALFNVFRKGQEPTLEVFSVAPLEQATAFLEKITTGWIGLPVTNTLAY